MVDPATALDTLPSARRAAIAHLLASALAIEHELARLYTAFATQTHLATLGTIFAEFGRVKARHVAALEPLVRAVNGDAMAAESAEPPVAIEGGAAGRATVFARTFGAERELEVLYREALGLVGDPALLPSLPALAADAAQHRARLRQLYLRYS